MGKSKIQSSIIRQSRCLAALRTTKSSLFQGTNSATWYAGHPTFFKVRLKLTCRDVSCMMDNGSLCVHRGDNLGSRHRYLANH